jgi:type I restriction enzyme S subunit
MNQTLEEIARGIFKSWFVDFDPVRAKMEGKQPVGMDTATANLFPDSFEESALGLIPRGWRVGTIDEVVGLNYHSINKNYPYETIEYIDISSVTLGRLEKTTTYQLSNAPSRAKRLVTHGDTIWSGVRPNRKSYLFIHNPLPNLVVSTGFIVLTPKLIPPSYLYSWVTTEDFVYYLTLNADGSAYPAVRVDHFAEALILIAPDNIIQTFEKNISVFRDKISNNENQSRTLANIRDTLLPKLMSGEIRVREAERMIEEVV